MASSACNGVAGARPPTGMSPELLVRVLHGCFFLLGMGLMAPITAILQTMDYLNIFFADFYPSRTLYTGYNTANLLALVVLFKFGEALWPNKRGRLLAGYSLYTVILVTLPLIDLLVMDHTTALSGRAGLQFAFTVWGVGSCVAGIADALISTVAYSQAAAIGQRFTHAFVGGRATSGLVMAALRCLSKGALSQNLAGLKQSTFIYVLIAAAIVFAAVIISGVVLPRLEPQIEALRERRGTCGAKVQVRALPKCTFCVLHGAGDGAASPDLCCSAADSPLIRPLKAQLPLPPVGPAGWMSSLPTLPTLPAAAAGGGGPHSGAAQLRSLVVVKDVSLPATPESLPAAAAVAFSDDSSSSGGSSREGSPRASAALDANLTVLSSGEPPGQHQQQQLPPLICARADVASGLQQQLVVCVQGYAGGHGKGGGLDATHLHCTCGKLGLAGSKDAASIPDGSSSSGSSVSGATSTSAGVRDACRLDTSWAALFRLVWPFCLAVQCAPMTTATILPLNLSSQVAHWPQAAVSAWHVQIMMVTVQLGFFLGSNALPIRTPRQPRVSLPVLAALIFVFGPIFAAALMAGAPPYVFLILALCLHTYSGYMTSTVFCVASQGFGSKNVVRVQQLLVLSMGVSYVVGCGISWIWVCIGRA